MLAKRIKTSQLVSVFSAALLTLWTPSVVAIDKAEPPDTNEPEWADIHWSKPKDCLVDRRGRKKIFGLVVKIGPGLDREQVGGASDGTFAVRLQKKLGAAGTWKREFAQRGTGKAAAEKLQRRQQLTRQMAVEAKSAFKRVLETPFKYGPALPTRVTGHRVLTSKGRGGSSGEDHVEYLFVARGTPREHAHIPDLNSEICKALGR